LQNLETFNNRFFCSRLEGSQAALNGQKSIWTAKKSIWTATKRAGQLSNKSS
tara:strand:- start:130 stop:285 length:156 start_codon:yes stop_codon:yes gene_type:complete